MREVQTPAPRSVLIVDDEETFRSRLERAFRDRGYETWSTASDFAVVDLRVGRDSGLTLVRKLHAHDPTTRIVMLTGYGSIATALDAVRSGAVHYLTKPAAMEEIIAAFDHDGLPAVEPPAHAVPSLDRVEREHIERVLADCGGNVTHAAELLGLHRRSLQRKLAKFPSRR
jgi:two-component system response regulator RegA